MGAESDVTVDRCVFQGNESIFRPPPDGDIGFGGQGGAIYASSVLPDRPVSLTVRNCVFDRNIGFGSLFYGRVYISADFDQVTCIIGTGGIGFAIDRFTNLPILKNCIVVSEPNASSTPIGMDAAIVSYSLVEGAYPGEGNIDADPKFVDIENGDLHLQRGSPCVDSGTDTGVLTDFDGNPRPIGRYDMGSFEYPFLRSDINVDGAVNAMDLLILQEDWGLVSQP